MYGGALGRQFHSKTRPRTWCQRVNAMGGRDQHAPWPNQQPLFLAARRRVVGVRDSTHAVVHVSHSSVVLEGDVSQRGCHLGQRIGRATMAKRVVTASPFHWESVACSSCRSSESLASSVKDRMSPGWQARTRQIASSVVNRMARAFPVLRMDRFGTLTPTAADKSLSFILRRASMTSRFTMMAMTKSPSFHANQELDLTDCRRAASLGVWEAAVCCRR